MRVCLDCTPFLVRSAGVKAYLFQLHKHLRRLAGPDSVTSFPFLDKVSSFHHEGSVVDRPATALRMALLYFANIPGNPVLDVLQRGCDIFHASNQVRNPPRHARLTTTLHDTTAWSHPELHTAATVTNDKRFADRIIKRAHGVITPSESSRRDAVERLGLHPDRVQAIHHGVDDTYFQDFQGHPQIVSAARTTLGLSRPYILFVSTIEPRKNLERLIDAYEGLRCSVREEFDLVVAGPRGWASENTMLRLGNSGPHVRYLGYVPEEFLPGLTAGATVFAYPSLYEGFGFPVAQAMAAGTPVITSNVSSLPEIAGDAALYVDPFSVTELRDGLDRLLTSPQLRVGCSRRGSAIAQRYRWDECARQTWAFFRKHG